MEELGQALELLDTACEWYEENYSRLITPANYPSWYIEAKAMLDTEDFSSAKLM